MRTAAVIGAIGFMLLLPTTGAQAQVWSGNDGGGIIPWSCQIEPYAMRIAAEHCAQFHKYPRVTGVQRHQGDFISFACLWSPYIETYARPAVPLYGGCVRGPGYFKAASAPLAAAPVAESAASAPAPLTASASAASDPEPLEAASTPPGPAARRQSPKSN